MNERRRSSILISDPRLHFSYTRSIYALLRRRMAIARFSTKKIFDKMVLATNCRLRNFCVVAMSLSCLIDIRTILSSCSCHQD
jgi:hypothetical protein